MDTRKRFTTLYCLFGLLLIACKKDRIISPPVPPVPVVNNAPVALAGDDLTIVSPTDTVLLDGSRSSDDGSITAYQWTKIAGPASPTIASIASSKTVVSGLVEGVYQFQLRVTDDKGVDAKDTVHITIEPAFRSVPCDGSIRKQVQAQLVPIATLPSLFDGRLATPVGTKIVFAGGYDGSPTADIFNTIDNSWSQATLQEPKYGMITAVSGNNLFIAGGPIFEGSSPKIDIYDADANNWSGTTMPYLAVRESVVAGAAAGNKVVFLSGSKANVGPDYVTYTFADIFNTTTRTWHTDTLHHRTHRFPQHALSDAGMSSTVIGNKIYFAGNASDWYAWDFGTISSEIDIYDVVTNTWTRSTMDLARGFHAAIAKGNKNYWAGGIHKQPYDAYSNKVEIRETGSVLSTSACLFQPNAVFQAAEKNNQLVFFTPGVFSTPEYFTRTVPVYNKFDIFDISSNTWQIGVLPVNIYGANVVSLNNVIYIAGGIVNGVLSDKIWKLEY